MRGGSVFQAGSKKTYTTSFPLTENPISENSLWSVQHDPGLTVCRTELVSGTRIAHGTMVSTNGFDDSSATLTGFARSHEAEGVVWIAAAPTGTFLEVEIHLGWYDQNATYDPGGGFGTTNVTGYEVNIAWDGAYANIGRFKAPSLLSIGNNTAGSIGFTPASGDVFLARMAIKPNGTTDVLAFWNGTLFMSVNDTGILLPPGNPGMGFYTSAAANNQFGFSSFTARDL